MLKNPISKSLSDQVNAEYYSAYLYLAMSAYTNRGGYKGISNWLSIQAQEELAHAVHLYEYILERGDTPAFQEIKAPPAAFGSIKEVFEQVLSHERMITERINKIASLALEEGDHATYKFIQWYIEEQVEEEASAEELLAKITVIGNHPGPLLNLDNQLAARVFNNPFAK
jgi:ferritin